MSAPLARAAALAPAAAYAALVFWLSHQSSPLPFVPRGFLTFDKLVHLAEYAVLAALLAPGLARALALPARQAASATVAAAALFALTDELHQALVPGRSAELGDWVADTAGAALGALAAWAWLRRREARASIRAT